MSAVGSACSLLALLAALATALLVTGRPVGLPPGGASPDADRAAGSPAGSSAGSAAGSAAGDGSLLRWATTAGVGLGTAFLLGGTPGLLAGPVAAAVCWWLTGRLEPPSVRRRREQLAAAVPHAVDLMAACLAAGLSPSAALAQVAAAVDEPLAGELAGIGARLRLGVDPTTVWRDLARHPQLGGLGRAVARAVETGASVADAMLRLAEDQRRLGRAAVESRARAVGVKAAVPLGVCLLPAFVLVGVVPLVAGSLSVLAR